MRISLDEIEVTAARALESHGATAPVAASVASAVRTAEATPLLGTNPVAMVVPSRDGGVAFQFERDIPPLKSPEGPHHDIGQFYVVVDPSKCRYFA